jgi:hypothetical protein
MAALGADMQIRFQIGAVENRFARRTLDPEAFRHGFTRSGIGALDPRGQQFF